MFFCGGRMGAFSAVLKTYSWLCDQRSVLVDSGPTRVPVIKPGSATSKASALPTELPLQPQMGSVVRRRQAGGLAWGPRRNMMGIQGILSSQASFPLTQRHWDWGGLCGEKRRMGLRSWP